MDFSRVDSQAVFFFFPAHLPLFAMSRFLPSETTAICRSFHRSSPFLSLLRLRHKVSQTLLKEKTLSSFELIHFFRVQKQLLVGSGWLDKVALKASDRVRQNSQHQVPFSLLLRKPFLASCIFLVLKA